MTLQVEKRTSKTVPELSYLTKPEWSYVKNETGFKVVVSILSSSIVYVRVQGYVDLEGAEQSVRLTINAIEEAIPSTRPYVQITDYSKLDGASREAQKHFLKSIKRRKRLLGLIFCGLNTFLEIVVKLGRRINILSFDAHIVNSYSAAAALAIRLLEEKGLSLPLSQGTTIKEFSPYQDKLPYSFILSDPDWFLSSNGFSTRFEMLGGNILHSISEGSITEKHIDSISALRAAVQKKCAPQQNFEYIIADIQKLKAGSRKVRVQYVDSLSKWHSKYPFKSYILYGVNRSTRAAAFLAAPFMPFKVRFANDFRHALEIIAEEEETKQLTGRRTKAIKHVNKLYTTREMQEYVSDLLHYLGNIDWDVNGIEKHKVNSSHPFYAIFEAVSLLKSEFDELLQERKKQEEEKMHLMAELQHSQKLESVGTLAGGIAHEFNNILGGIIGYAEIAREDSSENISVCDSMDQILKLGYRARDTVKQILFFSRKGKPEKRLINPFRLLKDELRILRTTIPSTIEIRENLDECSCAAIGDPVQIQQVVLNLCNNASQAMAQKGGVLEVSMSRVVLDAEAVKPYPDLVPGEYIELAVSDTGTGIDPSIIERIFDPYFTTKDVGKGTGLGLSVVHGIVRDHNGAIIVNSEVGKGTVFKIFLPKADGEVELKNELVTLPKGTERILLVDDEEFIVYPTRKILEWLGYEVTAFTSSLKALKHFKNDSQRYDIIITDLTMPHLTGDRLAAEVTDIRPEMPVILATGYNDAVDDSRVKQAGIRAFIPKPFKKQDLANIIRLTLDGKL